MVLGTEVDLRAKSRNRSGMIRPKQHTLRGKEHKKPAYRGARKTHIFIVGVIITMVAVWMLMWLRLLPGKSTTPVSIGGTGGLRSTSDSVVPSAKLETLDDQDVPEADDEEEEEEDAETGDVDADEPDEDETDDKVGDDEDGDESHDTNEEFSEADGESESDVGTHEDRVFGSVNSNSITSNLPPLHALDTKVTLQDFFQNMGKKAVNIDPSGSYKFIIAKLTDKENQSTLVVQGCPHSQGTKCKHPDAARTVIRGLTHSGISHEVLGGGRITRHHLRNSKKAGLISIFGYSKTYSKSIGLCTDCNAKACALITAAYPDYLVRWSNQGYSEKDESKVNDWVKCSEQ